jgi:hypothetical protein
MTDPDVHPGLVPLHGSAAIMRALWRPNIGAPWADCWIVARHPGGLVLREVGRRFPGHWLATLDQVRVGGPGSFSPGTQRITRAPRGADYGGAADHPATPASPTVSGAAGFSPHDR